MAKKFLDSVGLQVLVDAIKANKSGLATLNGSGEGSIAKAIEAEATRVDNKIGALGKVSAEEGAADHTVKSYVDAKVTEINGSAEKLAAVVGYSELATEGQDSKTVKARLEVLEGANTVEGSVAKALKDAKDYADGLDEAMDARVDKLEATHATVTEGEGEAAVTRFATVQEEAAAEVAKVVADAPEAFDTLKEIAQWIQKEGENGFDAAARITSLETKTAGLAVAEGNAVTVQNAIAKAVADEATRINGVVGTPDENMTIQGEIDAVEAAIATLNADNATAGSVAKSIKDAVEALDAEKESDDDAVVKVKVIEVDGKINDVVVTDQVTAFTKEEVEALFAEE